jgi:RNase P subunit RPR2
MKGTHYTWVQREGDRLVWRCKECSKKTSYDFKKQETYFEREGDMLHHHIFACYQPTEEEFIEAGLEPQELNIDFDFPEGKG